jgi:hypothetical protein
MNEPARYVKSEPRHDPNHEKECRQNQKKEVSQGSYARRIDTGRGEKVSGICLGAGYSTPIGPAPTKRSEQSVAKPAVSYVFAATRTLRNALAIRTTRAPLRTAKNSDSFRLSARTTKAKAAIQRCAPLNKPRFQSASTRVAVGCVSSRRMSRYTSTLTPTVTTSRPSRFSKRPKAKQHSHVPA